VMRIVCHWDDTDFALFWHAIAAAQEKKANRKEYIPHSKEPLSSGLRA